MLLLKQIAVFFVLSAVIAGIGEALAPPENKAHTLLAMVISFLIANAVTLVLLPIPSTLSVPARFLECMVYTTCMLIVCGMVALRELEGR